MQFSDRSSRATARANAHLRLVGSTTAPVAPIPTKAASARRRVEIVPLPEPTDAPVAGAVTRQDADLIPALAPVAPITTDRRQVWPGRPKNDDPHARLVCSGCGARARVDLVDLRTRRVHLSCDRCYRMWQDQVRASDPSTVGRRR